MSIHLSNKRNFILITSHKCAYTTVLKSNKVHLLLRKRFFKWLYYFLYLSLYRNKTYMLLRNPYERIRSCYFDKVLNCKILPGKSNKFLKLMVSVDGFNFGDDLEKNILILRKVSFEEFVTKMVPFIYNNDPHLSLQYNSISFLKFKTLNINIKWHIKKYYKLDQRNQMNELKELTNINFDIRKNVSPKKNLLWKKNIYDVIEDIYSKDFDYFNFKKTRPF